MMADENKPMQKSANSTIRIVKIIVVLLAIACIETAIYGQFAVATGKSIGASAALSPDEARAYTRTTANLLVIDVRSQKEFADGHIRNAVNMPLYAIQSMVKSLPDDVPILLHCQYGYRALQAYKLFRRLRPDIVNVRYVAGQLHFTFLPKSDPQ